MRRDLGLVLMMMFSVTRGFESEGGGLYSKLVRIWILLTSKRKLHLAHLEVRAISRKALAVSHHMEG